MALVAGSDNFRVPWHQCSIDFLGVLDPEIEAFNMSSPVFAFYYFI